MELGDSTTAEHDRRSVVEGILDKLNDDLADLISSAETGGLDRLEADQQVAVWQRFERLRNKLSLVDHLLITHADAADLPRQYCSATMTQFLVRILQLTPRRGRRPGQGCRGARPAHLHARGTVGTAVAGPGGVAA
jgi:hypothetical protein